MAGFIELIAKIKPKNNGKYPLVDDVDVEMEDGSRLSEAIKKPRIPDGGTEGQILAKKSNTNGDAEWVEPLKTEDIDKKLESKLDKNLGSENSDKVLTTDAKGNIITQNKEDFEGGGGTTDYNNLENKPQINGVELKGNKTSSDLKMYTQEEVDDLLYDKMDKPYKPITITDDITIEDCLDGRFKINKILGNTFQAEETDIVPTPQHPIPINSRKTTITKVNPNIFDFEKESDTSSIPDTGIYRSIGQHQLKANTKYIFSWSEATVPAKATLSFQIQDDKGTVLVSPFTYFNIQADEKKEVGKEVEFTTNESGIIKFAYNCTVGTSNTTEMYQQYWYTKILKDISLKEDVEYEPEYVELRSLKETGNIWDLKPFTDTNNTYYQSNDVEAKCWATEQVRNLQSILKPRTTYSIKLTIEMVHKVAEEGYTNASMDKRILIYRSQHETLDDVLVDICFTTEELDNGETRTLTKTFTTPDDLTGCKILWYTERYTSESGPSIMSTVKFKDITLIEGSTVPQTYIPPTIRDYKIVDHKTKTSKIIRNTFELLLTGTENWQLGNSFGDLPQYFYLSTQYVSDASNNVKNTHFIIDNPYDRSKDCLGFYIRDVRIRYGKYDGNIEGLKQWLSENNIRVFGKLQTPTEEEIAYSADDVSEIGYSWQDTTSPSPTIPAEIKGVDKIDITVTGKNLFDIEYVSNLENWTNPNTDGYFYIPIKVPKGKQLYLSNDKTIAGGRGYYANFSPYKDKNDENYYFFYHNASGSAYGKFDRLTKDEVIYLRLNSITNNLSLFIEDFKHLQLEVGDTATAYEPYTEQRVNITPPQPLYQNDVANVESGNYEYEEQKYIVTGDEEFYQDYQNQAGYYGRYFNLKNGNGILTEKIWCNYLSYILSSWGSASEGCCQNSRTQIHLKFSNDRLGITDNTPLEEKRLAFANYLKRLYASGDSLYVVVKVAKTTQPIPEEDLAKLKSLKTEQGITNIFVGGEVKPTIEARYALDIASIVSKLQTKLLTLQEEVVKNV